MGKKTPPPYGRGVHVKEKSMLMSLIFIVVVLLYLLPSYLAFRHESRIKWFILLANLFFGWTLLVWLILLLLALITAEI